MQAHLISTNKSTVNSSSFILPIDKELFKQLSQSYQTILY